MNLALFAFSAFFTLHALVEEPTALAGTTDRQIERASSPKTVAQAPRWLEKRVKPIVKKTVVTR